MLLRLLAITAALFLITSSNALSHDTPHHLARHQQIAARHPAVKRASVSTRCKKRNSTPAAAPSSTSHPNTPTAPPPPSSSQAPPASGSGKGKAGIAWPNGNAPYLKNFITEKVSVIYNWSPDMPQDTYGLEYIPMLWGQNQVAHFKDVVKGGYANFVLGFNEPDIADGQANIDPVAAAQIWMTDIQPLKYQGYKLITPAVAFRADWLQSFFKACNYCTFDHMAAHIYATTPQEVINYLTGLHNMFGMSIWVTEFGCQNFTGGDQCNEDQAYVFMTTLIKWMDETEWIDKYFYYGMMSPGQINIEWVNALINEDGTPTKLGHIYIGS